MNHGAMEEGGLVSTRFWLGLQTPQISMQLSISGMYWNKTSDPWRIHDVTCSFWQSIGARYHRTPSEVLWSPDLNGSEVFWQRKGVLYNVRQVDFGVAVDQCILQPNDKVRSQFLNTGKHLADNESHISVRIWLRPNRALSDLHWLDTNEIIYCVTYCGKLSHKCSQR